MMYRAAYYGEHGSYSEQAAVQHFGARGLKPCRFLSEVIESVGVDSGFGVVPIENSIEGAVTQTYDLLLDSRLSIVGEEIVRISHCLMALKGVRLKDVKSVYSHPQAIAQCRRYIEAHGMGSIPMYDTAGSAKKLKESRLADAAAIASPAAARIYGLEVIARDIQSNRHNYTRFLIVGPKPSTSACDKTTIAFSAKNRPGALFKALNGFADNGVNLLYIQSRPIPGSPWEYNFYIDCEGSASDARVKKAISSLRAASDFVRILGSYKKARFEKHA